MINFVLFHCILQLIYHIMSFQAESPSSGKFTALSFYLVTSLLFLVGVFIESIFMLHLQQTNEERALIQNYLSKWKSLIGKRSNKNLSNDKATLSLIFAQNVWKNGFRRLFQNCSRVFYSKCCTFNFLEIFEMPHFQNQIFSHTGNFRIKSTWSI